MNIRYRVHSCVQVSVEKMLTLEGGEQILAQVGQLVIELVEVDGDDTLTRRITPAAAEMEAAKATFAVGNTIVATLSLETPE